MIESKKAILIVSFIIGVFIMTLNAACTLSDPDATEQYHNTEDKNTKQISTNHNAQVMNNMSIKEHLKMYWQFFFVKENRVPSVALPQQQLNTNELFDGKQDGLRVSWLGHSSLLINIDGNSVLTDPIFENKVSIVGPTRFNKELPLSVDDLISVDVVLISHNHYDHLNKFSIQQLIEKTGVFIVPKKVSKLLIKWDVPEEKIVELNWWDEFKVNDTLTIVSTPSQHFSGRGFFDRNETGWSSWVIKSPNQNVFFSGDTGYFDGFKEIGDKYGPFDMTFLECGAYDDRWSNIHMAPEETVQAHIDLRGKLLQPIHWSTFNLALHPWYEPMERVVASAWNNGINVSTPVMGSIVNFNDSPENNLWWLSTMKKNMSQTSDI